MANMDLCDKHNMVAFLQKPTGSEEFYQIVDFLAGSHIRRHLQLADVDGISSLPNTKIFEQLTLMGGRMTIKEYEDVDVETEYKEVEYELGQTDTLQQNTPTKVSQDASRQRVKTYKSYTKRRRSTVIIRDSTAGGLFSTTEEILSTDERIAQKLNEEEMAKAVAREEQERIDFEKALELQKQLGESEETDNIDWIAVAREEQERIDFEKALELQKQLDEREETDNIDWNTVAEQANQVFENMLKDLLEEYLVTLWSLVKERFRSAEPTEDKERALWVELKRLFEPDKDDVLWKLQRYMYDPLTWRLYGTCGVHHVSSTRGHDIYMLIEKDYPLSTAVMNLMLSRRLQVEEDRINTEDGGDDATVEQIRKRAKNVEIIQRTYHGFLGGPKYIVEVHLSKMYLVSNFTNFRWTDSRPVLEKIQWNSWIVTSTKGNHVVGPSVVNMVEHNNSYRKPGHLKKDCKGGKVGNKANGSGTNGLVDGSTNSLKGQNMFNNLSDYESLNDGSILHMGNESTSLVCGRGCVDLKFSSGKIVSLLGHVHFKRMQDMSKDGLIPAFDMDTEKCKTCMLNKITKKLFQNVKRKTKVLELIHSDLCDLHATPSLGNKKYFVTFIDDASSTDWAVPWSCEDVDPFTPRIRNFRSSRKTHISQQRENIRMELEIHRPLKGCQTQASPKWSRACGGRPMDIDSYKDLKVAFLAYFMQQKKHAKDPVEIHNIKQKDGETIEEFMERFKVKTGRMKEAPECMKISEFMHRVNNPELTKRLNELVPKTLEEMMTTTTTFIRGETAAGQATKKKSSHHPWKPRTIPSGTTLREIPPSKPPKGLDGIKHVSPP
ncbi:zinc finger, CCHC-type containing protein [Tanacetum coccineum]